MSYLSAFIIGTYAGKAGWSTPAAMVACLVMMLVSFKLFPRKA